MTLDEILLALAASPCARSDPERIGRLAFLHWLDSLPDGADFAQEAVAAEELASRTGATDPATGVFRTLLWQATLPLPAPARRGRLN